MNLRKSTKAICLILATQMGLLSPVETLWAQNSNAASENQSFAPDFNLTELQKLDANLRDFAQNRAPLPDNGPIDARDPNLDQDPFFMRSQSWGHTIATALKNANEATAYETHAGSLSIQLPNSERSLNIRQPLAPVFETDNFLILQATDNAIFQAKAHDAEAYGEGLFFVDKRPMQVELARTLNPRPTPIYFLPLGGRGWSTKVDAISVGPNQVLAFRNAEGDSATVDADQLNTLSQIYQTNLVAAIIMTLKHDPALLQTTMSALKAQILSGQRSDGVELPFAYPARGSTAAFGVFFTGVNLEHPDQSIDALTNTGWSVNRFKFALIPEANANDLFTPDLVDRLLLIWKITSITYGVSFVAQMTVLRERMLERRALIEKRQDEADAKVGKEPRDRSGWFFKAKRGYLESIDVWVHGLNTVSTGLTTTAGFLAEYASDRFAGAIGRSDNGLIRRFLKWTFLYNRKQNDFVAANWYSFYLGGIILGGVDTAGVALQLGFVSAVFFPWVAHTFFGAAVQQRIDSQFVNAQAENGNNIRSEVLRNFSGYTVNGASSYSSERRNQFQEIIRPEVAKEFAREGKDPKDPRYAESFEDRVEEQLDMTMISRGLPSRKEFLFSAPTVVRSLAGLMGFKVDRTQPTEDGKKIRDSFVLENARWGLLGHVLKVAYQNALKLAETHPNDADAAATVELLKATKDDYHTVYKILRNPLKAVEAAKAGYKVRQMLTLLSYQGPVIGDTIKYTNLWQAAKSNPNAAQIAGRLFRQSLFAVTNNKPLYLSPTESDIKLYISEARAAADEELKAADPKVGFTEVDRDILALEKVKAKVEETNAKIEASEWQPEKPDLVEVYQRSEAKSRALARAVSREQYKEAYREELSKIVGLYALPKEQSELVRQASTAAEEEVATNLEQSDGWKQYINTLDDSGRFDFLTHQYADAFLSNYLKLTVGNSSVVSLTSPEQPGRFQRLRQKLSWQNKTWFKSERLNKWLNNAGQIASKTANLTVRLVESPMSNSAFKPGTKNMLFRNVPFIGDTWTDLRQRVRSIWVAGSVGYLSQYYIWQVKFAWPTYIFFFSTLTFVATVSYWLDRMMMNIGVKPMSGTVAKAIYSSIYTWATYPTYIPFFFFLKDYQDFFASYVAGPFSQYIANPITQNVVAPLIRTCSQLLGGG